jgi:anti-anti-sigma regulatory factor
LRAFIGLPKVLILYLQEIRRIDTLGILLLRQSLKEYRHRGTQIILSEAQPQVLAVLGRGRESNLIEEDNICQSHLEAMRRAEVILARSRT